MGDLLIYPDKGNCSFGSGKECWGFSVTIFAKIYAAKFKTDKDKMMKKLWGDNYFDAATKKWKKDGYDEEGKPLKRAFNQFIMDPLMKLARSIMDGNKELMDKMLKSLEINIKADERELEGKHLLKLVMSRWINAGDTILEMMVVHLPSPK